MNASEVGSKDWWSVIRSMPWQEAWQHLNDYRAELMDVAMGTPKYAIAAGKLTKINAEIKRINLMTDHARFTAPNAAQTVRWPQREFAFCL